MLDAKLRPMRPDDRAFVAKTWKETVQFSPVYKWMVSRMGTGVFFHEMNPRVDSLIAEAQTVVAANPEDSDHILGWACAGQAVLHFVYVRQSFRGNGLATAMVRNLFSGNVPDPLRCTHFTHDAEAWQQRHRLWYMPSILGEEKKKWLKSPTSR